MGVKSVSISTTGLVANTSGLGIGMTQQSPTIAYINTSDSLATVLVSGYLNESVKAFGVTYNNYQMALVHVTDNGGEQVWLSVYVTTSGGNHVYSLVARAADGDVATPTVANQITYSTDTIGSLASAGLATALFNAGNISAGKSGIAGILASFPTLGAGTLRLAAVSNTTFNTTISNVATSQSTVMSIPDVVAATGQFLAKTAALVSGNFPQNSGTAGLVIDSGVAVSALQLKANIKAGHTADIGGGGAGPITVTLAGVTTASTIIVNILSSSNPVTVQKVTPGTGDYTVLFSGDPGAACILSYVCFIAAQ